MRKLAATVVFLSMTASLLAADINFIDVYVTGVIEESDTTRTRDDIFGEAMRKGLRQTVLALLPPALAAEKSSLLDDKIFSRPGAYINNIEVLKEGASATSPNSYELSARVGISTSTLLKDLAALGITPQKKGYPRILVLIEQKNIDENYRHRQQPKLNDAESKVRDALWKLGFPLIDQKAFLNSLSEPREKAIYDGDLDTLLNLARLNDAQVIVFGRAVASRLDNGANPGAMASLDATVLYERFGSMMVKQSARFGSVHAASR
jgi:hypothetical protein